MVQRLSNSCWSALFALDTGDWGAKVTGQEGSSAATPDVLHPTAALQTIRQKLMETNA
jgi:hypothetical protein